MNIFSRSIKMRLVFAGIMVVLFPLIFMGLIGHVKINPAIKRDGFAKLQVVAKYKKEFVKNYLMHRVREINRIVQQPEVKRAIVDLKKHVSQQGFTSNGRSSQYKKFRNQIYGLFDNYLMHQDYKEIFLLDPDDGAVIYSNFAESSVGSYANMHLPQNSGLYKFWKQLRQNDQVMMSDVNFSRDDSEPVLYMGAPITDKSGTRAAILILQLRCDEMNRIMQDATGLGESGDSFVIGEDFLLRSASRFYNSSEVLHKSMTSTAKHFSFKEADRALIKDNHGKKRLVYFSPMGLTNAIGTKFDWAVVTSIDADEALSVIKSLNAGNMGLSMTILLLVIFAIIFTSRTIADPITQLAEQAQKVANGNLNVEIHTNGRADEIGLLKNSFKQMVTNIKERVHQFKDVAEGNLNTDTVVVSEEDEMGFAIKEMIQTLRAVSEGAHRIAEGDLTVEIEKHSEHDMIASVLTEMVKRLRMQITELSQGIELLNSSANEISSSTAELAASAQETASAVSETTATAEEIRQTVHVTSQKIQEVSHKASDTEEISEIGKSATDEVITKIQKIKGQMDLIADSTLRLSEQSQKIGEVISTVDDIAEQSNLLSVNAAIEAAKAGEHGKGFTVVAQEIKKLAEQSKQATTQVRNLLDDIQKATADAVMATEQGSKAVDAGIKQSVKAGKAIEELAATVIESARAFIQINATNQEQLAGIDQVTSAMENIKEATSQNAETARRLEEAAIDLKELGEKLEGLLHAYQI